jgi:hypothetical protein
VLGLPDIVARVGEVLKERFALLRPHLALIAVFLPLCLLAVGAGGYGLWWRTVAEGLRDKVVTFQAKQKRLGRELSWDSLVVSGFPSRIEAAVSAVHFMAPDRGSAWDAERVVVRVPPLDLDRMDLSLEGQLHYFYAREQWIETNARADKALVTMGPGADGRERVEVTIKNLTGKAKLDATDFNFIVAAAAGGIDLIASRERAKPPKIEVAAKLENVALQGTFDLPLGPAIQLVDIAARLELPRKLAEPSLVALLGELKRSGAPVELQRFALDWGGVSIEGTGTFKLDQNALPDGRFNLTLGNHPRILELLEAHGWLNAETRAKATKVLDVLAFMSGDKQRRVPVPLRIQNGNVYAGPAKIATLLPAPTASMQFTAPDTGGP